jgi:enediyne biosynthesis protein E5
MTSAGFILFSLYMIPDPATTPIKPLRQVLFGVSVATIYALLFVTHVVFGLFIALALTSATRGLSLHGYALWHRLMGHKVSVATAAPVSASVRAAS